MSEGSGEHSNKPLSIEQPEAKKPVTRRGALALLGGALATSALDKFNILRAPNATHTPEASAQNIATLEVDKPQVDFKFVSYNEETKQFTYRDVAEYLDNVQFSGIDFAQMGNKVIVRNEPQVIDGKEIFINTEELNNREIGLIRAASTHNNQTSDSPEHSFTNPEDPTDRMYQWFILARETHDPQKPYAFVNPSGEVSNKPYFVGPNFVTNLDAKKNQGL